jgi:hypothetical protein
VDVGWSVIDDHGLYDCHDLLLEHKAGLFDHLVSRWRDLFNVSFGALRSVRSTAGKRLCN